MTTVMELIAALGEEVIDVRIPSGTLHQQVRRCIALDVLAGQPTQAGDAVVCPPGTAPDDVAVHVGPTPGIALVLADAGDVDLDPWSAWGGPVIACQAGLSAGRLSRTLERVLDASTGDLTSPQGWVMQIGDLDALADAMADQLAGPVILEDADFHVLAYSSFAGDMDPGRSAAILGKQMPQEWTAHLREKGALDRLRTTSEVVDIADGPWEAHRRLLTSVRAGSRMLGIIWVAETNMPLPDDVTQRLREAAVLAVPHFLHHEDHARAERARRGRLLLDLLDSGLAAGSAVAELGVAGTSPKAVICLAAQRSPHAEVTSPERIATHVMLIGESLRWTCTATWLGELVYALLELDETDPAAPLRQAQQLSERLTSTVGTPVLAGSSSVAHRLTALPRLKREAEDVVSYLSAAPSRRSASFLHVQPTIMLRRMLGDIAEDPTWKLPGLDRLAEHDERKHTTHLQTLVSYLAAAGNISAAGRTLNIHPTTMRYRLEQITRISGLDLDDHDTLLACELALRGHWPAIPKFLRSVDSEVKRPTVGRKRAAEVTP